MPNEITKAVVSYKNVFFAHTAHSLCPYRINSNNRINENDLEKLRNICFCCLHITALYLVYDLASNYISISLHK